MSACPHLCSVILSVCPILHLNNFHRGSTIVKHVCQTDVRIWQEYICICSWGAPWDNTSVRVGSIQLPKWAQPISTIHCNKEWFWGWHGSTASICFTQSHELWFKDCCIKSVIVFSSSGNLVHYIKKNELDPTELDTVSHIVNIHFPLLCWWNFGFIWGVTVSGWMVASASSLKAHSVHVMDTFMANDTHAGHSWGGWYFVGKRNDSPDRIFPPFSYLDPWDVDMKPGSPATIC